jgi:serine/threonine protein kinase, bacterial
VLSYLHSQRPPVIFRDLKPANVILTPEGRLKLIDFGIARLFKPGQSHDTQAYGTMGYSAPEQYGRGQTDARSDIYSLAVLLHQLLTGFDPAAKPFNLPPADQVNPALPPAVAATLARAMQNAPEQRFASVEELRQTLRASGNLVQRSVQPRQNLAPAVGVPPAINGRSTPGGTQSTALARVAFWMGAISLGAMLLATLLVGIGRATGSTSGDWNNWTGVGALLTFLPFFTGPAGGIVGIVALTRPQIKGTTHGRRDAVVGIAMGFSTLLLCCVIAALLPSSSSSSGREGATFQQISAYNSLWSQTYRA